MGGVSHQVEAAVHAGKLAWIRAAEATTALRTSAAQPNQVRIGDLEKIHVVELLEAPAQPSFGRIQARCVLEPNISVY
jgi:hypothetical protein